MDLDSNSSGSTVGEMDSGISGEYTHYIDILKDLNAADIIFSRDGVRLFHYQGDDWQSVGTRRGELVLYYDKTRRLKYLLFQQRDEILSFQPIGSQGEDCEIHQQQTNSVNWIAADCCADHKHYEFCARFSHCGDDQLFIHNLTVHVDADMILGAMKRRKSEDLSEFEDDTVFLENENDENININNNTNTVSNSVRSHSLGVRSDFTSFTNNECVELRALNQSLENEVKLLRERMSECQQERDEMIESRNEKIKEWEEMSSTVGLMTQQNQWLKTQLAVVHANCQQYALTLQSVQIKYGAERNRWSRKELQLEQMMIANAQLNQRNEQLEQQNERTRNGINGSISVSRDGVNDEEEEEELDPSYAALIIQCNAISQSLRRFAFYREGTTTIVDGVEILAQKYVNLWNEYERKSMLLTVESQDGNDEDL